MITPLYRLRQFFLCLIGMGLMTAVVHAVAPAINSDPTDIVEVDTPYTYSVTTDVDGGPDEPLGYSFSGDLPDGLSLSATTGEITGTPTETGVFTVILYALNSDGASDGFDFELTVLDSPLPAPEITSDLTAIGRVGYSFAYTIAASNEPTSYSAIGVVGVIDGLFFDSNTGEITGIPDVNGTYGVLIEASNAAGSSGYELLTITIEPALLEPEITSSLFETAVVGVPYSYEIEATNSPTSFGLTGDLPAGLSRTGAVISGTPEAAGTFSVSIIANNAAGSGKEDWQLTVVNPIPEIAADQVAGGEVGQPFSYQIVADYSPTSYAASGLDPIGLALDSATGIISGEPTASGEFDITLTASNESGESTAEMLSIVIVPGAVDGEGPTVTITDIGDADLAVTPNPTFDADSTTLQVVATVVPDTDQTVESVYVRWKNPPSAAGAGSRIIGELLLTDDNSYSGVIDVGFMPNASEIGGGDIEIEVVATQRDADDLLSFGTSPAATFEIAPLVEFLYPLTADSVNALNPGDLFASVRVNTNAFASVTATITGAGVADSIVDADDSDNDNGVFNFEATTAVNFPGTYSIDIVALDTLGNETRLTQSITIDNNPVGPSVLITSPTTGFTTDVFSPAQFTWAQSDGPNYQEDKDGIVTSTDYTYRITQITEGSGYYPRNATNQPLTYNIFGGLQAGVATIDGHSLVDGRLPQMIEDIKFIFTGESPGFGLNGGGVVDNADDPGAPAQITLSAEMFANSAALDSYQMYVNGELVKQSSDPINEPAVIRYPSAGSPLPGHYVLTVVATDVDGNVTSAKPRAFEVLAYEVPEVSMERTVDEIEDPTAPLAVGGTATFSATVSPNDGVEKVVFIDSISGDELGEAVLHIDFSGEVIYRQSIVFAEQGPKKVYAQVIFNDGRITDSSHVDLSVILTNPPNVSIDSPTADQGFSQGSQIEIQISADDSDGSIAKVEVFNGANLLGEATLTDGTYRFEYDTEAVGLAPGTYTLTAKATDNLGVSASTSINVLIINGQAPNVSFNTEPEGGKRYIRGSTIDLVLTASDPDGSIETVEICIGEEPLPPDGLIPVLGGYSYTIDTATAGLSGTLNLVAKVTDNDGNQVYAYLELELIELDVSIDSPVDDPATVDVNETRFIVGDSIDLEITAADLAPGFITKVEILYGEDEDVLGEATWLGGDQYRFTLDTTAAGLVAGTHSLSVRGTDNSGNVVTSDSLVVDLLPIAFAVAFTNPTDNPFVLDSAFVGSGSHQFEVELSGVESAELQSVVWLVDGVQVASSSINSDLSLLYSQEITLVADAVVTVVATNNQGIATDSSIIVDLSLAQPLGNDSDFVTDVYQRLFATAPTEEQREAAMAILGDDTLASPRASFLVELLNSDDTDELRRLMMVYRTMLGEWPNLSELNPVRASLSAQSLVEELIPEFESHFALTFPTASIIDGSQASALVAQLFENKHGSAPSALNWNVLSYVMTGEDQFLPNTSIVVPGYVGSVTAYAAAFATDNALTQYAGETVSSVHYYEIPSSPVDDVPLALLIATFLEDEPTAAALAKFSGLSQLEAFEAILNDERYIGLFDSAEAESPKLSEELFVAYAMLEYGSPMSMVGPEEDADGDGQSNLLEIVFAGNPVDSATRADTTTKVDGNSFVFSFTVIDTLPGDYKVYAEYSCDLITWSEPQDIDVICERAEEHPDADGYNCVELHYNLDESDCGFVRLTLAKP